MKQLKLMTMACLAFIWWPSAGARTAGLTVANPRVQMMVNPIGVSEGSPDFSWELSSDKKNVVQKSYRIQVAYSCEALEKGKPDVWDSGERKGDRQNYVAYAGAKLKQGMRYWWRVQVKTNKGTSWSAPAFWQMALDGWSAPWIGRAYATDVLQGHTKLRARYLRKDFATDQPIHRATLYICGLGLYEAYVNGRRVGRAELAPTPTDYNITVKYNAYDVTSLLRRGNNAVGVVLGNGRFVPMRWSSNNKVHTIPQLTAQLVVDYANGTSTTIRTDNTWKITADGPIGNNNEYDGEEYDARKEMPGWSEPGFDDSKWQQSEIQTGPKGRMVAQDNPNITIMDTVRPKSITELKPGVFIVDMGQNMVGWLRMKVRGKAGQTVKAHFAEMLQKDGSLYVANLRTAETTDTYIMKGGGEEIWEPSFTYHGFRFVEITGLTGKPALSDITGEVLYDQMATTGTFSCSNDIYNKVYHNAFWGIRGNYRGMPTDCPQRDERVGWTGDRTIGCLGEAYIFDNHRLYAKWVDDIGDDQRPNGSVSDVNPIFWSIFSDNMTWPGAWLTVCNMLYDQYGDAKPLFKHYAGMKKWMLYMKEKYMKDGILTKDTYGDWCMPPESLELIHSKDSSKITDGALISTSFYYFFCGIMSKFAALMKNADDVAMWNAQAEMVKDAFNRKFYDAEKGWYGNNTVTANMLPLRFGMVPVQNRSRVFQNIASKTENEFGSHVSAGLIGVQQLMRGLTDYGRGDLAWTIASNKTYPSWGYMAEQGATTIWELWNGNTAAPDMNSGNHVMLLGDLILWTYSYLGGIGQTEKSCGFSEIKLKPWPVKGLDSVKCSYRSIYGEIGSRWQKQNGRFNWDFTIPAGRTAVVCVPAPGGSLSADDVRAVKRQGGRLLKQQTDMGYTAFSFPSGSYHISVAQ
jgi:alpha-L-rhamnosidase